MRAMFVTSRAHCSSSRGPYVAIYCSRFIEAQARRRRGVHHLTLPFPRRRRLIDPRRQLRPQAPADCGVAGVVVHSMIWSARARSDDGMARPSALAVLRLITSSNFVGCSMGKSPGRAPRRMRSTYRAMRWNRSCGSGP
jgi:hypothetical protein